MTAKAKVLVIVLDAAEHSLIKEWAAAGELPTFRRMMEEGTWGDVEDRLEWTLGGLMGGFMTGVTLPRHAFCELDIFDTDAYEARQIDPYKLRHPPFWEALSEAGRRVALIDIPRMRPSENLNGIQIIDWGAHDPYDYQFITNPESLAEDVKQRFGIDPVGNCDVFMGRRKDYTELVEQLEERVVTKTRLTKYFLERGGWDAFVTTYSETHCVGHQCWHLHDPNYFQHDAQLAGRLGDPLKRVYRALDRGIGELVDFVGEDATVIVVTLQGIGPHHDATYLLDDVLRRMDSAANPRFQVLRKAWRLLPHPLREFLRPAISTTRDRMNADDKRSRRYFQVQTNVFIAGLRFNVAGRERYGMVQPGDEYERLKRTVAEELKELRDADSGRRVVTDVIDMDELIARGNIDGLPDLLVVWDREAPILGVRSPRIGEVRQKYDYIRSGDHCFGGMYCAIGTGTQARPAGPPVSIKDFAPTVAALLETSLTGLDGRPIAAICGDGAVDQ